MYRRMISGMLAVAMTFQMCAGTVHAAGNAKQVTSQPAGTELFVMQEQAEEMAAVESAADFMPETSTETNKETSAEENTEGNADATNDKNTDTTIDEIPKQVRRLSLRKRQSLQQTSAQKPRLKAHKSTAQSPRVQNRQRTLPLRRARRSQPPSVLYKQRTARRRRMRREILISCFRRAAFR